MITEKPLPDSEPEYSDLPGIETTEYSQTENKTDQTIIEKMQTEVPYDAQSINVLNSKFFEASMAKSAGSGEIDGLKEIERGLLPENPPLQPKVSVVLIFPTYFLKFFIFEIINS